MIHPKKNRMIKKDGAKFDNVFIMSFVITYKKYSSTFGFFFNFFPSYHDNYSKSTRIYMKEYFARKNE
jgi:hypothetical protein